MAGGALSYEGGRQEQAVGAVLRWVTTPWLSFSATPTAVHVQRALGNGGRQLRGRRRASSISPWTRRSRTTSRRPGAPVSRLALGVSLPLGDTATGFGAGKIGLLDQRRTRLLAGRAGLGPSRRRPLAHGRRHAVGLHQRQRLGRRERRRLPHGAVLGERRLQHRHRRRGLHGRALDARSTADSPSS